MAPTPAQTEAGYRHLWTTAEVKPEKQESASHEADRIKAHRAEYDAISAETKGVPWFMVGALHDRESSLDFKTHLHCGDSLYARTHNEPRGRPKAEPASGHLPYTFQESAIDALTMQPHALDKIPTWSVERLLYECEKYNGWGYLKRGNSPYLWSWTNHYDHGKYVGDHNFDPNAVDKQPGVVAIFKALALEDPSVAAFFAQPAEPKPSKEVEDHLTKGNKRAAQAGAATTASGTVAEGTKPDESHFMTSVGTYALIGVGIAVILMAAVLAARKKRILHEKWGTLMPLPEESPHDLRP